MNSELRNALEVLKRNCEGHKEDCEGCILQSNFGCYLPEKLPEDYDLEKFEIESECKE